MARKRKHESVEVEEIKPAVAATPSKKKSRKVDPIPDVSSSRQNKRARKNAERVDNDGNASSATLQSSPTDMDQDLKDKGKGKDMAWATAGHSAPAIAVKKEETQRQVDTLKATIAKMQLEIDFKDQVLNTHRDLLTTVQASINCHICMETFKDPMTLVCGHSFCRSCLFDYFHQSNTKHDSSSDSDDYSEQDDSEREDRPRTTARNDRPRSPAHSHATDEDVSSASTSISVAFHRKARLACPDCRTKIEEAPFPVFVIKDVADQVRLQEGAGGLLHDPSRSGNDAESSAAVKLPSPEPRPKSPFALGGPSPRARTQGQPKDAIHSKRPKMDPKDKTWGGLFPNGKGRVAIHRGMADHEDGVRRCVYCNWEVTDGECQNCGAQYDVSDEEDPEMRRHQDSEDSPTRHWDRSADLGTNYEDEEDLDRDLSDLIDDGSESEDSSSSSGDASDVEEQVGDASGDISILRAASEAKEARQKNRLQQIRAARLRRFIDDAAQEGEAESEEEERLGKMKKKATSKKAKRQVAKSESEDELPAPKPSTSRITIEDSSPVQAKKGKAVTKKKTKQIITTSVSPDVDDSDLEILPPRRKASAAATKQAKASETSPSEDSSSDENSSSKSNSEEQVDEIIPAASKSVPKLSKAVEKNMKHYIKAVQMMRQDTDDEESPLVIFDDDSQSGSPSANSLTDDESGSQRIVELSSDHETHGHAQKESYPEIEEISSDSDDDSSE